MDEHPGRPVRRHGFGHCHRCRQPQKDFRKMNRKQFVVLLVVFVVLGLAGLGLYQRSQSSWQSGNKNIGQKLLGELPVNDVTRIIIKQGTNEVNLVKKDELWRVQERKDYPANYSEISGFLLKLRDLKAVQSENVGASQ